MVWKLVVLAVVLVGLLAAVNRVPLKYTLRNLTVRWKTTILTALAFTLVIGVLVVMLAFVNGMQKMTEGTGLLENVLVLSDGATDESFSNLNAGDLAEIETLPEVQRDPQSGRPLASRETYLIVNQPLPNAPSKGPQRRFLQTRGIEQPLLAAKVHGVELLPGGNWFSEAGVQEMPDGGPPAIQAVLGEGVARELAADRTPEQQAAARTPHRLDVGEAFRIGDRTWVVTGIMKSSGTTFGSEIWAKQSLIGPLFGKSGYTTLLLRASNADAARKLKDYLTNDYGKVAVNARIEREYYADMSETSRQFTWAIGFVTVIMAVGGVFGVMNTMFAAISQRIKDIGVLRLLGYARWQILVSLLLESLVIALVGGLLGCALGSLADGLTASSMVTGHSGGGKFVVMELAVDAWVVAVGILLTLLMGGIGGLAPALSAMRLRPLDALR